MSTESRSSDNQVISKSTRLLEENALAIHKWLLFSVAIFSLVFSFISVLLGDYTQAWISILSVPGVCIAYMLMRMQFLYLSKLFNAVQIIVMIASISLLSGINSLSFMFFFPVIISIIMAFKENEKKTAYSLVAVILIILIALTAIASPIGINHLNTEETLLCDKNMIVTTLRNLISNAVKFSSFGSVIKIRSQKYRGIRSFEVEDFGKGINLVQLKKLREGISFTTLGTNNEKGNGFGLQLVQEFLRRHKSHLEIQSELGKGSVFSFNL